MNYEYDVFLSYSRIFPIGDWVKERFLPFLEGYLRNDLKRPPQIFYDSQEIRAGDDYPERLKRGLAHARSLVAVWSPSYFFPPGGWCEYECNVMRFREQQLGYRTSQNPSGLIFPVIVHDGEHFPEYTQRIQSLSCQEYALIGQGFTKTELYCEFQRRMLNWTKDVACGIDSAPPWIPEMNSEAWLNNQLNNSIVITNPTFKPPTLG